MVCEGDQRGPGSVITLIPDLLAVATVTPVGTSGLHSPVVLP